MKKVYFISYDFDNGNGNTDVTLNESITCMDDIKALEVAIAKKNGHESIVITNYILF